jgi:TRAP-type C4-dicarboxylate transport system permease large subunit
METIETTASVLFIVAAASIFAWVLTTTQVTDEIARWVLSITNDKWVFLILVNLFLLFVGCFMETIAAITILVPVLLPIAIKLGIDPIHFGIIFLAAMEVGYLCPPAGLNIYFASAMFNKSIRYVAASVLPAMGAIFVGTAIIGSIGKVALPTPQ